MPYVTEEITTFRHSGFSYGAGGRRSDGWVCLMELLPADASPVSLEPYEYIHFQTLKSGIRIWGKK